MNLSSLRAVIPPPTADTKPFAAQAQAYGHRDRAHAGTDHTGGDPGTVTTEVLPNGVRLIVAERPGAASTRLQIGIGAGALQDPKGKEGLAHLLEHLAFEGSPTRSATKQERTRAELGGQWNAYTTDREVVYYGVVPGAQARQGASLLTDMFRNPSTTTAAVRQEKAAVKNEMVYRGASVANQAYDVWQQLMSGEHPAATNVIGTKKTVDAIEPKDLRQWHERHMVGRNTVALVEGDPKRLPVDVIRRELGKLPPGAKVDNSTTHPPVKSGPALQVINDTSTNNVQLDLTLPFESTKATNGIAPLLAERVLSDTLATRLRRQKDLTYRASASVQTLSPGQQALSISTSVPKQHARVAMDTILETLKDARDGFGPQAFETAKRGTLALIRGADAPTPPNASAAASALFDAEVTGSPEPLQQLDPTPASVLRNAIGRTKEANVAAALHDMVRFDDAKLFAVGAVADGGAALRDALIGAEVGIDRASLEVNPVKMNRYRDMGMKVTADTVPKLAER